MVGNSAEGPGEERLLGVVEALVAVRDQCPNGAVRGVAERALEEIKSRRPGVLREQAYLMLSAMQGWRGGRARQVHASLSAYLETAREPDAPESPEE